MKDLLPEEICWRKDKKGFGPPQEKWLASNEMKDRISKAEKSLRERGIIKKREFITEWQVLMVDQLYRFAERNWND